MPAPSAPSTASRPRGSIWCCPSGRCSRARRRSPRPRSWCGCAAALEPQQIRAIRHVVASAVNGLKPQRVSIVDEAGQLLADGAADDTESAVGDERRAAFEKRMRKQVEAIVSSVVGAGRARVQLSADFDYNKITQTSDKFDPEGRVLRSSQTREESSAYRREQRPGHRQQRAAGQPEQRTAPRSARDQSKKSEETNNYEISRTTKTEVTEAGRVNRISVAVLVDGSLFQERKRRDGLSGAQQGAARPHRGAGALGDRLRPEARRPGRGRQPANSPKRRPSPRSPSRPACSACCSSPRTT